MRKTNQDVKGRMLLSYFTVPKGTEVRATTPEECPTQTLYLVVHPLRDIPEAKDNPILRHDLTHRFVFVPEWATIRV